MELTAVESSNIAAIGYEAGILRVRFRDGAEYDYAGVTQAQHLAFLAAESKGRWLNEFIVLRSGRRISSAPDKPVDMMIREAKAANEAESDWSYAVV